MEPLLQTNFKPAYQTFCKYEHQFTTLLESILYEKNNNENILQAKAEMAYNKALSMFSFEGDEEFKRVSKGRLKDLCALKPGRILIKALLKTEFILSEKKIKLIKGTEWILRSSGRLEESDASISCIMEGNYSYNGLHQQSNQICEAPQFVALAHEIIHFIHEQKICEDNQLISWGRIQRKEIFDCLSEMDNLEEQHTISGFSHLFFQKSENLTKIDILCENTFLLALGLLPRINHRERKKIDNEHLVQKNCLDINPLEKNMINIYSEWMKTQLDSLYNVPSGKEFSFDFMLEMVKKSLSNFNQVHPDLKNYVGFITCLMRGNESHIPSLIKKLVEEFVNPVLIVKSIMELHKEKKAPLIETIRLCLSLSHIDKQLLFSEEVVLTVLKYINNYSDLRQELYLKINSGEYNKNQLTPGELIDIRSIKFFISQVEANCKSLDNNHIKDMCFSMNKKFKVDLL